MITSDSRHLNGHKATPKLARLHRAFETGRECVTGSLSFASPLLKPPRVRRRATSQAQTAQSTSCEPQLCLSPKNFLCMSCCRLVVPR